MPMQRRGAQRKEKAGLDELKRVAIRGQEAMVPRKSSYMLAVYVHSIFLAETKVENQQTGPAGIDRRLKRH